MKRVLALMLAILLVTSMVACSKSEEKKTSSTLTTFGDPSTPTFGTLPAPKPAPQPAPEPAPEPTTAPSDPIADFVAANGQELQTALESSFASMCGMTCTSSIEALGTGILIYLNVNEMDNLTAEEKASAQKSYDELADSFDGAIEAMQADIPGLEYISIYICEKDGDIIAEMRVD